MKYALYLVIATFFWAGNLVFGAVAVATIDPVSLNALRWGLAAIPLLVIAQLVEKPDWREVLRRLPLLLVLAILGYALFGILIYSALELTSPLNASLINALSPALIVVASAIVFRSRIRGWTIAGLLIALAGVALVITDGDLLSISSMTLNPGDLYMFAVISCWTAYTLVSRRLTTVPPITSTAVQMTLASVIIVPIALVQGLELPGSTPIWLAVAFIVIFPSIGGYLLWNAATRKVSGATAGIYINLIPVFAALQGLPFGYGISFVQVLGGLCVIGAVLLISLMNRARAPEPAG